MGPIETLPDPDARNDYLIGVLWAIVLGIGVLVWGSIAKLRGPMVSAWIAKAMICLTVMLFYDYTYGVDIDGYFGHASSLGFSWQGFELGQGTLNTRTLTWLHYVGVSSSYNATRLSFALIGFMGMFFTYRAGSLVIKREDPRLFFAFAFMPSILFWSSILGKDPIAFFGIAVYTYGVVAWHTLGRLRYLIWVALGLTVAVYIRMWFGPILLIPLALLGWMRSEGVAKRTAFVALGAIGVLVSPLVLQESIGVDFSQKGELLQAADTMSRMFPTTGSSLEVPDLATGSQLLGFAPLGIFTALFRPLPGEVRNVFGTLTGLENAFLLFLAVRAVWRTRWRELKEPLVGWAILTVLIWASVYSVAAFQNLGTMSRYKLQITPLLVGLLFYLGRRRDRSQVDPRLVAVGPRQRPLAMRPEA